MKIEEAPLVSVVLPVYYGEKTLKQTLDSLLAQSFQNFELLVCIDGSDDGSENMISTYIDDFSHLEIFVNSENRGLGATMNRLISHARGLYIAVAEQDDYYYPDRLQLQVEILRTNDHIGLVSGIAEFYNGNKVVSEFPGLLVKGEQYPIGNQMFLLNYREQIKVVNSCMMFKKKVHVENGLYFSSHYPSVSVDWSYILRFCLVSNIYGLHQTLVRIDRHSNRVSVTTNKKQQFKAARELIRSFKYEKGDLVTKTDFKYALRTQKKIELGQYYGLQFYLCSLWYVLIYYNDSRFYKKAKFRIQKKLIK